MAEIYVSTDIEADGPIPARYSHIALDDAIEQGELWLAMRQAARANAQPA